MRWYVHEYYSWIDAFSGNFMIEFEQTWEKRLILPADLLNEEWQNVQNAHLKLDQPAMISKK
jgi:hypothetical protein